MLAIGGTLVGVSVGIVAVGGMGVGVGGGSVEVGVIGVSLGWAGTEVDEACSVALDVTGSAIPLRADSRQAVRNILVVNRSISFTTYRL